MSGLNIIIPIGGLGDRFSKENYHIPKPLILARGKPMIYWVINSLKIGDTDKLYIAYTHRLIDHNFEEMVMQNSSLNSKDVKFCKIFDQTRDVQETVSYSLKDIAEDGRLDKPTVVIDCDTFYTGDVLSLVRSHSTNSNIVFYKYDTTPLPLYSYISINDDGFVSDIREKVKISDNANIGVYSFQSAHFLKERIQKYKSHNSGGNGDNRGECYMSHLYGQMLKENIRVAAIKFEDIYCIGTPFQLKMFGSSSTVECSERPLRFCFDLDNTLVSSPRISGDYSTVEPIQHTICFLKFLKTIGHTIIIHTARRMKTHAGNNGRVLADVGKITFDTLDRFEIPYDEIYFGKPYADFYIDDKAINSLSDVEKNTGFYNIYPDARSFNRLSGLIKDKSEMVLKSSPSIKLWGEIWWYNNIPSSVCCYFPKPYTYKLETFDGDTSNGGVFDGSRKDELKGYYSEERNYNPVTSSGARYIKWYEIEKIIGIPLSYMYTNRGFTVTNLQELLGILNKIHTSTPVRDVDTKTIYSLYRDKLLERSMLMKVKDDEKLLSSELYNDLLHRYDEYKTKNLAIPGVVHGDPVFSNILIDEKWNYKFIDMRGILGEELTIFGDTLYDYAKIYQSILGYDAIVAGKPNFQSYFNSPIRKYFDQYIVDRFGVERSVYIKYITLGLFLTLLPLHDSVVFLDNIKNLIATLYKMLKSGEW